MTARRHSARVLAAIDESSIVGIRAGDTHRFTGVWAVVVESRVFVRSWNDKPTGWRRAFETERRGALQLGSRHIPVRGRPVRSARLLGAVDQAYAEKYHTPASRKWVRGLSRGRRRSTTLELLPS